MAAFLSIQPVQTGHFAFKLGSSWSRRVIVASVFITGSADGLGRLAAQHLVTLGHDVILHGRDQHRAQEAMRAVPGARTAVAGDLASIKETRALAEQANAAGPFQTVIQWSKGIDCESVFESVDRLRTRGVRTKDPCVVHCRSLRVRLTDLVQFGR